MKKKIIKKKEESITIPLSLAKLLAAKKGEIKGNFTEVKELARSLLALLIEVRK